MYVKNSHIIHMVMDRAFWYDPLSEQRYLCCGSFTLSKATDDPTKVTCKNCLREMRKRGDKI